MKHKVRINPCTSGCAGWGAASRNGVPPLVACQWGPVECNTRVRASVLVAVQDGELLRADQEAKAALQRKRALEQRLLVQTQMVARAHMKVGFSQCDHAY